MIYLHLYFLRHFSKFAFLLGLFALPSAHAQTVLQLVTAPLPPFSFEEDQGARGIAVDLVKEAFSRLHVPIQISYLPMARAQSMVASGTADAIFPLAYKKERLTYVVYPKEKLVEDRIAFFVRSDATIRFDGNIAKLGEYTFGVERGAVYGPNFSRALSQREITKTDEAATQAQNVSKLVGKRFDIAVGPRLVLQYSARMNGQEAFVRELTPAVDQGLVAFLGFSRQKQHAALMARYDKVMQEMRRDGTYERILRNYTDATLARRTVH